MSKQEQDLLFVYGTLLSGHAHPMSQQLHLHARLLGPATLQGEMFDLGDYPGLRLSAENTDQVHGELYQLREGTHFLQTLDTYEGCSPRDKKPWEYQRMQVTVMYHAAPLAAWTYVYQWPVTGKQRIPHGDYLRWCRR